MGDKRVRQVVIIGGGLAGLSAALYLGRNRRDTLLIHSGHSMAKWESDVQNYLGFPDGIGGAELLSRGRAQASRFQVEIVEDEIQSLAKTNERFHLEGHQTVYHAKRVLIATGLTHLPPEIPGVNECLGRSLFFCKDCDAFRVQGNRIVIIGRNNEAAEYALAMLLYSPSVMVATNGEEPRWGHAHAGWLQEYQISVRKERICEIEHEKGQLRALIFEHGTATIADSIFTTRGDIYHTPLAEGVGAALDPEGQLITDDSLRTTVPGVYAAGCVTAANCQMIIAAGQGAIAAQTINRELFEESLRSHALPTFTNRDHPS